MLTRLMCLVVVAGLTAGCGGSGSEQVELVTVTGKVTYQGTAVTEGTIQFEDVSTGISSSSEVGGDGGYELQVAKGNYKVTVRPPVVEIDQGPDSPPIEGPKEMDSIPQKYRQTASSDLTANVSSDGESHNFDMQL